MPKQARLNGIKSFQCYTANEAAIIVGVSARTIRNWTRNGLQILDSAHPALIRGDDLREFIKSQRENSKIKIGPHEFYCLRCRASRKPAGGIADCVVLGSRAKLVALCEVCETVIFKPIALARIAEFGRVLDLKITGQAATLRSGT